MNVTDIVGLSESSGYSLEGSFTPDLVFSKLWLIDELVQIQPEIDTMYVLGSWYGNLALLIDKSGKLSVRKIINVETNAEFLKTGQQLLKKHQVGNTQAMMQDANKLNYQQLGNAGVVVNTALNNIAGRDWFEHIPDGTLVVMQARDRDAEQQFSGLADIQQKFPLSRVLYQGKLDLADPETEYTRFMTIGIK